MSWRHLLLKIWSVCFGVEKYLKLSAPIFHLNSVMIASTQPELQCWFSLLDDDVIKWKHFPRYWPFVRGIHRSTVNSPYKGQWRGALMFSLICVGLNGWMNNREARDLRRYRAHYDVNVMRWHPHTWMIINVIRSLPQITAMFNPLTQRPGQNEQHF